MTGALSTRRLAELVDALPRLDGDVDDAELIDQIRLLERLKSAAAATQARVAVRFAESQRAAQAAMGVDDGRGIASQIGLAKRESPVRAGRYLGWADVLVGELPQTFAALQRGDITEWRAVLVARGTGRLSREHRALVDAKLGGRLKRHGDRQVDAEVKKIATGWTRTAMSPAHVVPWPTEE
jgi:hypothetical protein